MLRMVKVSLLTGLLAVASVAALADGTGGAIRESAAACRKHSANAASLDVRHMMRALCESYWRADIPEVRESIACSYERANAFYADKRPPKEALDGILRSCE